jgi:hypothetical protein
MRLTRLMVLAAVLLIAIPALAVDPAPGANSSPSLGGTVHEGRATNSWSMPANGAMGLADVWNAMSWNGMTQGMQWRF